MRSRVLTALAVAAAVAPTALAAQAWRNFDAARQLHDSSALAVKVTYGAGRVIVRPDRDANLFDAHLRYDADRSEPIYRFDPAARRLELGVRFPNRGVRWNSGDGGELRLALATAVDLDLSLDVGAAESSIDLTGLRITAFAISTGASDTRLRIDAPNPVRARSFRIDAGAANVETAHLANANAERITVNVGVGRVLLDLTGDWRGDVDVDLTAALGKVELVLPPNVGVRISTSSFLQSTDFAGLTKRDGAWVSDNWESAPYKVRISSSGALGRFELKRSGR